MTELVPIVLAFQLSFGGQARDAWFGEDKLQHFFTSFAATQLSFGFARLAGLERGPALGVAATAAFGAGIAKELFDRRRDGLFSVRDLVWDAGGVAAGVGIGLATR